jgi:multidrug efflux pump subunit AcrA (membrane-fusion protein)
MVDIFAEVQGVFKSSRPFRPGSKFHKGETLVAIDNAQELATLRAQRSTLLNQIATFLPDIKFDYPEAYDKWADYVSQFDIESTTQVLPAAESEREKFFIASKNISSVFYNIKNLEARLYKYRIRAPFSGVLTETFVNPGALIRPGQKLGTLMSQGRFELALPVREEYAELLTIGKQLALHNSETGTKYNGRLVRVNPTVNPATQSMTIYVQVSGDDLKDGMFLNASLSLDPIQDAFRISRKLLIENQFVFGVESDRLVKYPVEPVHYEKETVVVKGLPNGKDILEKALPGARDNMQVEIVREQ